MRDLIKTDNYKSAFTLPFRQKIMYEVREVIDKFWLYHKLNLKKKYALRIVTVSEYTAKSFDWSIVTKRYENTLKRLMGIEER